MLGQGHRPAAELRLLHTRITDEELDLLAHHIAAGHLPRLAVLHVGGNHFSPAAALGFANALAAAPNLVDLDVSSIFIARCQDEAVTALTAMLRNAPRITSLSMARCHLEPSMRPALAAKLVAALAHVPRLQVLSLEGCVIGNDGAVALAASLRTGG